MKTLVFFFAHLLLVLNTADLHQNREECIATYIKAWGIAKYFHPSCSKSNVDIDSIFIADIKSIVHKPTKANLNKVILNMMDFLDEFNLKNNTIILSSEYSIQTSIDHRISWMIDDKLLFSKVKKRLSELSSRTNNPANRFVTFDRNVHTPIFKNERKFITLYPNQEIQLLAIARYWNIIQFFYPYKYMIETNWENALNISISKILKTTKSIDYHLAILELCVLIHDGHGITESYVLDSLWGFNSLPIRIENFSNKYIVTGVYSDTAFDNPFKIGDIIVEKNDQIVETIFIENKKYLWGSNEASKRMLFSERLIKSQGSEEALFLIERHDSLINLKVKFYDPNFLNNIDFKYYCTKDCWSITDNVLYIDLNQIDSNKFVELVSNYSSINDILLDLRNYPSWILDTLPHFFKIQEASFAQYRALSQNKLGMLDQPIKLNFDTLPKINSIDGNKNIYILVNNNTISRGEFQTMALQCLQSSLTIGNQTSGADGNITHIQLPGSIFTSFSGLEISYPSGAQCQGNGVFIDIHFSPSGHGIINGIDEELEFAINYIIQKRDSR